MKRKPDKSDRALELFEKGLSVSVIAERLGSRRTNIAEMIRSARSRREKEMEGTQ